MYFFVDKRAGGLGLEFSSLNVKSNEKIIEALGAYREIVVRDRRNFYYKEIKKSRAELATIVSELNFIPYISKYLIEVTVLLGALVISAFQYALNDFAQATATLAIFLAAGSRVAPGVLRIQQGLITIRSSNGQASQTLDFIETLNRFPQREFSSTDQVDFAHKGFEADIELNDVNFWYPNTNKPALSEINLSISRGTSVAIVGPSGSGKTTLIDTLLGVLTPDSGSISISGNLPLNAASMWPGAISYIPQDVEVISGTLRENVCLGFPHNADSETQIMKAIRIADLQSFVDENDKGLDYTVHERGIGLSGGQRQRLGLARAVFSEPRLLVLDEATSALDAQSEFAISSALLSLKGSTTVVMIAHRLSSVRNVDLVIHMEDGRIIAQGNFETVRKLVPLFDVQAKLLGLE
jgi:ABC-type multidrug transport system fused ATPase/permease subunit